MTGAIRPEGVVRQISTRGTGMWAAIVVLMAVAVACEPRETGDGRDTADTGGAGGPIALACPSPMAKDTGLAQNPDVNDSATATYVRGLCFQRQAPYADTRPVKCSKAGACPAPVTLRISPEYRAIMLPSSDLKDRGRVVALITNQDASGKFEGWNSPLSPKDSVYLWLGPDASRTAAYPIVFTVTGTGSTAQVKVLHTGTEPMKVELYTNSNINPGAATASWVRHMHLAPQGSDTLPGKRSHRDWTERLLGVLVADPRPMLSSLFTPKSLNAAALDAHKASWISCLDGCCVAQDVYE